MQLPCYKRLMTAETVFTPVRTSRLSEEIIRQIARLVESGQFAINERFPSERTLERQWQVSRPVLREAFRALEVQGFVESRPGGGRYLRASWIPDPAQQRRSHLVANRENLLQIWDAREGVETKAVELAAVRATPAEIAALERSLESLASLPPAEAARLDFNRDFHLVIARAARNSLIEEMMNSLVARCNEIGFREMLDVEDFAKLLRIHQPIFDAIVARDSQAARTAMIGHFNELRRTIGEI
jgi:GntR family transcriptional regulator, transcriptional repressor for pyruvate dehydrogenase complex